MDRTTAWALVQEYTTKDHLLRHMLACESAMRAYAPKFNGDVDLWGVVGLLHDFDYDRYPDMNDKNGNGHPLKGATILRERGVDETIVRAVLSHAPELTGVHPNSDMEKALFAVDELTGFIVAVTLVRPTKSILEVELKSVKKKWKDKTFAAPVRREEIEHAAAALGVTLDEHIQTVLSAMQADAEALGLKGNPT
ncbi:MAG: HD domain-containing protein [Phototrophicaceae bacterium]|jgi:putative nucleotidyltransferase with HDIG domain